MKFVIKSNFNKLIEFLLYKSNNIKNCIKILVHNENHELL